MPTAGSSWLWIMASWGALAGKRSWPGGLVAAAAAEAEAAAGALAAGMGVRRTKIHPAAANSNIVNPISQGFFMRNPEGAAAGAARFCRLECARICAEQWPMIRGQA